MTVNVAFPPTVHTHRVDIIPQATFTLTQDKTFNSKVMALSYMSGQFQIPPDSELFSAVYLVYSPYKLTKPLTVEIQHCAILSSDKQCAQFAFVSTKYTIKKLDMFRL